MFDIIEIDFHLKLGVIDDGHIGYTVCIHSC